MDQVFYQVYHTEQCIAQGSIGVPFLVGRQEENEPAPVLCHQNSTMRKLVIAKLTNRSVPRLALEVSIQGSSIFAKNVHSKIELQSSLLQRIAPGESVNLGDEGTIVLPDRFQIRLSTADLDRTDDSENGRSYHVLNSTTKMPTNLSAMRFIMEQAAGSAQGAVDLVRVALSVFHETPGSEKFFQAAVHAAVQMIDVDRVVVLMKEKTSWKSRAEASKEGIVHESSEIRIPSQTLLQKMERLQRTVYVEPQSGSQSMIGRSMMALERAVASPIIHNGVVVGALYGDRASENIEADRPIGDLEQMMLEVLAGAVASGLAVEREQTMRSSLSMYFSERVLNQLEGDQRLLEGQDTEVSVLFCDVRGFSAVTERAGPKKTIEWINDVLTVLSQCVHDQDGVLVDYIGDELMAMWGAPGNQPDHARRACQAAVDMLAQLEPLALKWKDLVDNKFGFGIGISTGSARCGNTGSKIKFKYGPLGNTVNLASRVQGISKQIGVSGLMTGATAVFARREGFMTRRLTKVRVVGIKEPIDLYELLQPETNLLDLCERYEAALAAYENRNFKSAAGILAELIQKYPDDRPTIILLSRTVNELTTTSDSPFDPVWTLTQK